MYKHQAHMLQASEQTNGTFTDGAPASGWDTGGANVKEQQSNYDAWDDDWNE